MLSSFLRKFAKILFAGRLSFRCGEGVSDLAKSEPAAAPPHRVLARRDRRSGVQPSPAPPDSVAWFRRARHHRRTRGVRQRAGLPVPHACTETRDQLAIKPKWTRPLPAPNQRQGPTVPPHPRRRLGPRPLLLLRNRTPSSPRGLAPLLQSPPTPQRHRRPGRSAD